MATRTRYASTSPSRGLYEAPGNMRGYGRRGRRTREDSREHYRQESRGPSEGEASHGCRDEVDSHESGRGGSAQCSSPGGGRDDDGNHAAGRSRSPRLRLRSSTRQGSDHDGGDYGGGGSGDGGCDSPRQRDGRRRRNGGRRSARRSSRDDMYGRRGREFARKMAMQAPMQMAMMHGMMGGMPPLMHMAMMHQMGMAPAGFLPNGMRPPHLMHGVEDPRSRRRRRRRQGSSRQQDGRGHSRGRPRRDDGSEVRHRHHGGGSSSPSFSSSDSSSGETHGMFPHGNMAAMGSGMWPRPPQGMSPMPHHGGPPPFGGPGSPRHGPNSTAANTGPAAVTMSPAVRLEAFLAANPVDPEAADRVRALPVNLQQAVMKRGPVSDTRNPSAVLIARVRDAELGRGGGQVAGHGAAINEGPPPPVEVDDGPRPARRSAKVTIETMIRDYRLVPGCAWMLRALPPDKQKLAARIDPAGQADPSGYVAEQMKKIV
eukprot:TRINITY_DN4786_c2_g1_i2.p1 TRINITY_DN4786_c2_g1~~TRINITY_DN4786_c2_g1_i2.p1  ORF type:complete len:485 (-),score=84.53 TRINITY_DN4786_c2_g1_i2:228-1682(-)